MQHNTIKAIAVFFVGAFLLTSCDPGYDEYAVINNATKHTVTIIPGASSHYNSSLDSTIIRKNESYTIEPGEEVVVYDGGGVGSASRGIGILEFRHYYKDSVIFRFDDSRQVVYYKDDTTGISPYCFSTTNYIYIEKQSTGLFFNGNPYYGKLTFAITDEHYQSAQ